MRPYLAIIADSFREALASRVLWILLILITLFLVALIPLSFRSEQTAEFRSGDLLTPRELVQNIHRDFEQNPASPGFRIWSEFNDDTRKTLTEFQEETDDNRSRFFADQRKLLEALNGLLPSRKLYDAKAWTETPVGKEAQDLLAQGIEQLPEAELARLNRLLVEAAYTKYFRPQPPRQIIITYLGFNFSPPIRMSEKRVKQYIEQLVLPAVIGLLVGFLGVLAAILVTAPIIPQMFDPGSLSLLLSKPISRSLLFLAKFFGGCAFILINMTYLVVGLWAIVGLRFEIWSKGLLLCIPIFLFLFAIYYSISAIAGVIWRNAVVCVVMTVLFWLACTVVGSTKGIFEQLVVESKRFIRLVPADDSLIALDENGATHRWNEEEQDWAPVFLTGGGGGPFQRVMGPVFDTQKHVLLAATAGNGNLFTGNHRLLVGKQSDGWMQADGPSVPDDTFELLPDPQGRLLAVTNSGVHQLVGDLETKTKKTKVLWVEIPQTLAKPFRPSGPTPPLRVVSPATAAADARTGNVVIYSHGELTWLSRQGDDYGNARSAKLDVDEDLAATLAYADSTILVALADGRVLNVSASTLTLRDTYQPEPDSQPRFVCASSDGKRFAILFHNGRLYTLDVLQSEQATLELANVRGQSDISAATFTADNKLLVADRVNRVTTYETGTWNRLAEHAPALTPLELAYYYAVVPIYTVFPKPGELGNTVQYLLRDEKTIDVGLPGSSLETKRVKLNPWAPVRSSLIFMLIVLGLACIYVERQDF